MELNHFRQILSQVAPLTNEICLHVTGEPLVHPDFEKILYICKEQGMKVQLTTNGILLERFREIVLKAESIRQINISLQAFMDNFPSQNIESYLMGILDFIKEGSGRRPDLYFNLRLWNQGSENDQNSVIFDYLEKYFQIEINRKVDVGHFKSKRIWNKLYLHFDSRFEWPSLESQCLGSKGTCKGLIDHIAILADGEVIPCCLDKDGIIGLGNCLNEDLKTILARPRVLSMREGFGGGELREDLCQRCGYVRRFDKAKEKT